MPVPPEPPVQWYLRVVEALTRLLPQQTRDGMQAFFAGVARAKDVGSRAMTTLRDMFGPVSLALFAGLAVALILVSANPALRPPSTLLSVAPDTDQPMHVAPAKGLAWKSVSLRGAIGLDAALGLAIATRDPEMRPIGMRPSPNDARGLVSGADSGLIPQLAAAAGAGVFQAPGTADEQALRSILRGQAEALQAMGGVYSLPLGPDARVHSRMRPVIAADGQVVTRADATWRRARSATPTAVDLSQQAGTPGQAILRNRVVAIPLRTVPVAPATPTSQSLVPPQFQFQPADDGAAIGDGEVTALAAFRDSATVAIGRSSGRVSIATVPLHNRQPGALQLSGVAFPDSPTPIVRIATRANADAKDLSPVVAVLDSTLRLALGWISHGNRLVFTTLRFPDELPRPAVVDMAFSPDGVAIAVLTLDGRVFTAGLGEGVERALVRGLGASVADAEGGVYLVAPSADTVPAGVVASFWRTLVQRMLTAESGPPRQSVQQFAGDIVSMLAQQPASADGTVEQRENAPRSLLEPPVGARNLISRAPIDKEFLASLKATTGRDTGPPGTSIERVLDGMILASVYTSARVVIIPASLPIRETRFPDADCGMIATSIAFNNNVTRIDTAESRTEFRPTSIGSDLIIGYASGHISVTSPTFPDRPSRFLFGHAETVLQVLPAESGAALASRDALGMPRVTGERRGIVLARRFGGDRALACPSGLDPPTERERIAVDLTGLRDPPPPPPFEITRAVVYPHISRSVPIEASTPAILRIDRIALSPREEIELPLIQRTGGEVRVNFDVQALDRVSVPIIINDIRYCNPADADLAAVLRDRLRQIGAGEFVLTPIGSLPNCRRVRPGTLEIWYAQPPPRPASAN